jgi:hypothetical protein
MDEILTVDTGARAGTVSLRGFVSVTLSAIARFDLDQSGIDVPHISLKLRGRTNEDGEGSKHA